MSDSPDRVLEVACEVAHAAGALIRENFGAIGEINFKGNVNPVTATDTAAEAIIVTGIRQAFPNHRILGEESRGDNWHPGELKDPTPIWLVDPIDGTNNFAHGFPHVAVSLGVMVESQTQVGVIYDPLRDETFTATRGGRARCNGREIHVSRTERLANAFLATGFPYSRRVAANNNVQMLDVFLRRSQGVRRVGSAALDMAYVACGRFDGFWEPQLSPWDLAAGILIAEEAGGRVSDFSGRQARLLSGLEVLVSNGHIHQEMLIALRDGPAAPHPDFPELS